MFETQPALRRGALVAVVALFTTAGLAGANQVDPLPSWKQGTSREAIVDFVSRVTKTGGPDHVPPSERIAVFDNDGTLWSEKPVYFQLAFAIDRVRGPASAC